MARIPFLKILRDADSVARNAERAESSERRAAVFGSTFQGQARGKRDPYPPGILASSVRKQLKIKELTKKLEPSVRKRMERKKLGSFSGR